MAKKNIIFVLLFITLTTSLCSEGNKSKSQSLKHRDIHKKDVFKSKSINIRKKNRISFNETPAKPKSEAMNEGLKIAIIVILCSLALCVILFFVIRFLTKRCQQDSFNDFEDVVHKPKVDATSFEGYANPKAGEFNPYERYLKKGNSNSSVFDSNQSSLQNLTKSKIRN